MRTAVIGIGNLLLGDDGVGIRAVERLSERGPLPVTLMDAGTSTLDVLPVLLEHERVIFVDAVRAGREPGTVYRIPAEDLGECTSTERFAHGLGLPELLSLAERMGGAPEVVLFGVEPAEIRSSLELSAPVAGALPELLAAIDAEVALRD